MIFRSADEADAVQAADFLGKKQGGETFVGFKCGKAQRQLLRNRGTQNQTHKLRNLRDHECVLVHCERGFRRVTLPPLEADGTVSKWFQLLEKIVLNEPVAGLWRFFTKQI